MISISEFFAMGGYGYHVWGIMLMTLVIMIFEPISLVIQRKRNIRRIKQNKRIKQRNNEIG